MSGSSETEGSLWRLEARSLWVLALPLAAVHGGNQLKSLVDMAVVGRLGEVELAGVGLANAFAFVISILGTGAVMGVDPLIAQAVGAGEMGRARRLLWQAVWLSLVIGLVLAVPTLLLPYAFVPLGIEPAVAEEARIYMWIRAVGLVPLAIFFGQKAYLQSVGMTRALIASMVISNIVNLGATILLVFGGGDLPLWTGPLRDVPAMGVAGSAWATVICTVLQLLVLAWGVRKVPTGTDGPIDRRPVMKDMRRAFRVGLPVGLQYSAEVGVFALVGFLAGRMGALELASHQVALTLASMSFTVALGVSSAGSVRVGRAIGAGDVARARVAGFMAMAMGVGVMGVGAVVFWLFPEPLASIVTTDRDIILAAVPLLGIAAVFQLSDGLQAVAAGVLRGAGDTRFSFLMNVAGHYLVGLPVAVGLGIYLDMGTRGLWWGLCSGLTVVSVGLVLRFARLSRGPIERV